MRGEAKKAKARRQAEALERQAAYDALSLGEKIARALARGHDKTREYRRLMAKVSE